MRIAHATRSTTNAAENRQRFPDFAAFVDDFRETFGADRVRVVDVYARGTKGHVRWLRCKNCKHIFSIPGFPSAIAGVIGVSCVCGRIVGVNRRVVVAAEGGQVPLIVTPGLSLMGETHAR